MKRKSQLKRSSYNKTNALSGVKTHSSYINTRTRSCKACLNTVSTLYVENQDNQNNVINKKKKECIKNLDESGNTDVSKNKINKDCYVNKPRNCDVTTTFPIPNTDKFKSQLEYLEKLKIRNTCE